MRDAYRYCQWITAHHYENFPVGSRLVPRSQRPHVAAIYAFARSADDFSDEAKYRGRGLELLEQWRAALWACADGESVRAARPGSKAPRRAGEPVEARMMAQTGPFALRRAQGERVGHPIFVALAETIRRCELPVQLLDDLLTAFRMDVVKSRYADWEELLDYCRCSANPVGRLVLAVFGIRDPELDRLSDRICTGLQLANHWQDLAIDFLQKDRLYIPQNLMREYQVRETDLRQLGMIQPVTLRFSKGDRNPFILRHAQDERLSILGRFQALMKELVRRAREQFDQGAPLIGRVPGRLRLELRITLLGGRAILERIEAADFDVFRRRPVLSTASKLQLLAHAFVS